MKKYMLLVTGALLCASFSVVSANNASPTEKSTVKIVDDYQPVAMQDVIIKATNDLKNDVTVLENTYISFEQATYVPSYKMGALKNKVNIIYLFYRVKV